MAAARPQVPALKVPRGRAASGEIDYLTLSFAELDAEVGAWCARLASHGVRRGDRTLVMVPPGLPLIASAFALFRIGAIPVVIDPGMGLGHFLSCVDRTRPRALIGIPMARLASRIFRRSFRTVSARVAASGSPAARLAKEPAGSAPAVLAENSAEDLAAILFTSGSTGAPKGVCYEHGVFDAQVRLLRDTYGIAPGEIDLPMLPIFALFNPALGMTTIVPEIDPRRPAAADPAKIVQAIRQEGVTNSFGSPTLWRMIADHCLKKNIQLPSLRRVLCAGAPVPAALWSAASSLLPNGRLHSPYGATEALPVSSIDSKEHASLSPLPGACVGRPLPEVAVKIIATSDLPIPTLGDARELAPGEIGEIIASGPVVTRSYDGMPEATASAKIGDGTRIWHRMGDCGALDSSGRIWYCGRKAERVETVSGPLFTEPCEQVFRRHPRVARCALIGLGERGRQEPAIVAETPAMPAPEANALAAELRALARGNASTAGIRRFYFRPNFPVDVRHNAKIHRLALARWAAKQNPIVCD